ncbi:hypothetical protein P8831_09880 [Priestia megaterium]|uniref:hypothetical protein n=1 Tax=Priestia megaterium TaxID=1404 RepID=UPI002D7EF476|nr:hypothetical protein [Priestia megaterium]MEB4869024.1 hypothetical protein [Priestia megaterium]
MNTPFAYFRDNIIGLHEMNNNSTRYIEESIERLHEKGYTDKVIHIAMMVSKEKLLHAFDIRNTKGKFTTHIIGSRVFNYKYAIRYAFKVIESEVEDVLKRLERLSH